MPIHRRSPLLPKKKEVQNKIGTLPRRKGGDQIRGVEEESVDGAETGGAGGEIGLGPQPAQGGEEETAGPPELGHLADALPRSHFTLQPFVSGIPQHLLRVSLDILANITRTGTVRE